MRGAFALALEPFELAELAAEPVMCGGFSREKSLFLLQTNERVTRGASRPGVPWLDTPLVDAFCALALFPLFARFWEIFQDKTVGESGL